MFSFLKRVLKEYGRDRVGQLSAAFAYTAVFSIGPLLLVLISIIGFIYGQKAASGQLFSQLSGTLGPDAAHTLQRIVAHTGGGGGVLALVFGIVGVILGATAITGQLQNSFDQILRAAADPAAGIKFTIYTKLKNFMVVAFGALVVMASLAASSLLSGLGKSIWLDVLNDSVSLLLFFGVFYLVYRFLPDLRVPRPLAAKTAAAVSVLFLIGKIALGILIGRSAKASVYGAAASLVALLLWFYYSGQIILLGAVSMKVYAKDKNIEFKPKRYAAGLRTIDIRLQGDFRGQLVRAFSRGYTNTSKKR